MSEEVTYADLKFQDCRNIENTQQCAQVDVKAPPAPSQMWRPGALALTILCLLLLIGLGVLGSIFYQNMKIEKEELKRLQNFKEELQRNISLQMMYNMDSSKQIRNFSIILKEMATKLCYELYKKEPEHKCKPCPEKWMWHEDSCYALSEVYETWQRSHKTCSTHNASLLKIKNRRVLNFIKLQSFHNYWLGLSPTKQYKNHQNLDETIISSDWFTRNTNDTNDRVYCGYLYYTYVSFAPCTNSKYAICEKLANPVEIESVLMNDKPDGM